MRNKFYFIVLFVALMVSCVGEIPKSPVLEWKDMTFRVETRPPFIEKGMMEFLIIVNLPRRKPASGLLVNLRIEQAGKWVQAIEDGNVGVYRRAMRVRDPKTDTLYVKAEIKGEETILAFPLAYGAR
ncbi:MAG: hypothetical protein OEZ43_02010 [Gammaproteobacteria bacterium]|nr:hypothetical protein [Gammaproteobacteria bacterium]